MPKRATVEVQREEDDYIISDYGRRETVRCHGLEMLTHSLARAGCSGPEVKLLLTQLAISDSASVGSSPP